MTLDQIIQADAKRTGRDPGDIRFLINRLADQEAQVIQSGKSAFLVSPNAERSVEFLWFTADHKTFTQDLDKFLAMLKKAKVQFAASEYTDEEGNDCFAKSRFKPKLSQVDGRFRAEVRL